MSQHVISGEVLEGEWQTVIRRISGICKKLRIFRSRYIVGTLTNKLLSALSPFH